MEESPFAKLPAELRNRIYEHTLHYEEDFTIAQLAGDLSLSRPYSYRRPLALARTCRAIRQECLQLFFSLNRFIVKGPSSNDPFDTFQKFRDTIGEKSFAAIKAITLDLGILPMYDFETVLASHNSITAFVERGTAIVRAESQSGNGCRYILRATFEASHPEYMPAEFELNLNAGDLQDSWDANIEEARQRWMADAEGHWKPIMFTLREARHQSLIAGDWNY